MVRMRYAQGGGRTATVVGARTSGPRESAGGAARIQGNAGWADARPPPFDALAYWGAWSHGLYGGSGVLVGYIYAPAFAQLMYPLTLLPFEVFRVVWAAIGLAAYAWLLAPLRPRLAVPLLVACLPIVANGNIEFVLALVAVVGFTRPASWSAILLTKVTPAVGLLWFAVRREWGALAVVVAATLLIAAVSALIAPHLWLTWFSVLVTNAATPPLPFFIPQPRVLWRLPFAALLVAWGAWTGRRWVIPVAMLIATPDILVTSYGILAALPRLSRMPPLPRMSAAASAAPGGRHRGGRAELPRPAPPG
jgi:hypothetical protein